MGPYRTHRKRVFKHASSSDVQVQMPFPFGDWKDELVGRNDAATTSSSVWTITEGDRTGWQLLRPCYWHSRCRGLTVADIASQLAASKSTMTFGANVNLHVPSIFHAVLVRWALRQVSGNKTNASAAVDYIETLCNSPAEQALQIHEDLWPNVIGIRSLKKKVLKTWDTRDLKSVMDLWREACFAAAIAFDQDRWKSVRYGDSFDYIEDEEIRKGYVNAGNSLARAIGLMRAEKYFPDKIVVFTRCTIIGDNLIRNAAPHSSGSYYVEADVKETLAELEKRYFMGNMENVLICTGLSVAKRQHTTETYRACLAALDQMTADYNHIRWWVIPPPEIEGEADRAQRLITIASACCRHMTVVTAEDGSNIWRRPFAMDELCPADEDYGRVFRRLYELGLDVLPLQPEVSEEKMMRMAHRIAVKCCQAIAPINGKIKIEVDDYD